MADTYALMRSLCETKRPQLRRASKWRPPSANQLTLEKSLTSAIAAFIVSAKLSKHGVTLPDEAAHERLLDAIHEALEQAVHEGHIIATGRHERGIINAAKNLAGRAVQLVSDIIDTLRDKARDIIDAIFGDESIDDPEAVAEEQLAGWAVDYSEGVAENEIQMAVQETIIEEMKVQGIEQFDLVLDPAACPICVAIWEKTPVVTAKGPLPPFHYRCRCGTIEH